VGFDRKEGFGNELKKNRGPMKPPASREANLREIVVHTAIV